MPLRLSSSFAFAVLRPACGVGADKHQQDDTAQAVG